MMDYAGRLAKADTFPKLLRLNATEHGGEIALREKDLGLWRVCTWNDYQTRVHDFALGMIEHDMGVVMDISHRVMVLDFGRKIAEGDPASVLADPHVKRAYLGEEDEVLVDPDDTPAAPECAA